jgi:hypothetical protein
MPPERRRRRDAEDEVEDIGAAEVDCLGRAIMTIGAQQNFCTGPIGADGAQQATQEALGLLSTGALGRPQHGGDEAAGAVKYDDRRKAVFVMMRVEEAQLLAAVDGVEGVVDVERDALGDALERLAIEID